MNFWKHRIVGDKARIFYCIDNIDMGKNSAIRHMMEFYDLTKEEASKYLDSLPQKQ